MMSRCKLGCVFRFLNRSILSIRSKRSISTYHNAYRLTLGVVVRFPKYDRYNQARYEFGFAAGVAGFLKGLLGFDDPDDVSKDPLQILLRGARDAHNNGEFMQEEKLYHEALQHMQTIFEADECDEHYYLEAVTFIYDNLANLAMQTGQFVSADALFKETMKGCLQLGMEKTDNAIVEISIKLATIYAMLKRHDEAKEGFKFCIETQEAKVKENPDADDDSLGLLGIASETYGRFMLLKKDFCEAEKHIARATEIGKKILPPGHPQVLVLQNDLATVKILKNEYNEAESILTDAIKSSKDANVEEMSSLHSNLGAVFMRQDRTEEARRCCTEALRVAKRFKDELGMQEAEYCLKKLQEMKSKS